MLNTLNNQWKQKLSEQFAADYFLNLTKTICSEYESYVVYPPKTQIFAALNAVEYSAVKVCILGQDPYHGEGQANGMAFAVCDGNRFPPSLVNIFKELIGDIGTSCGSIGGTLPTSGTLLGWAKQGVLLLNTTLTVRQGQPQSHLGLGWERFTDAVISVLSDRQQPLVFILWGSNAIAKTNLIDSRHKIIASPHPSPLSAHRGFFGSKPFSKANAFLVSSGQTPIDWLDVAGNRAAYYATAGDITIL